VTSEVLPAVRDKPRNYQKLRISRGVMIPARFLDTKADIDGKG